MVVAQDKESAGRRANAPGHGAEEVAFGTLMSLPRTGPVPDRGGRPRRPPSSPLDEMEVIGDGG
jgi:hypothetical protein